MQHPKASDIQGTVRCTRTPLERLLYVHNQPSIHSQEYDSAALNSSSSQVEIDGSTQHNVQVWREFLWNSRWTSAASRLPASRNQRFDLSGGGSCTLLRLFHMLTSISASTSLFSLPTSANFACLHEQRQWEAPGHSSQLRHNVSGWAVKPVPQFYVPLFKLGFRPMQEGYDPYENLVLYVL